MKPGGSIRMVALSTLLVLGAACERRNEEIKVYRLAKAPLEPGAEERPAAATMDLPPDHPPIGGARPAGPVASTSVAAPSAAVPSNWEPQPLTEMRKASYLVRGADGTSADISFVSLGGSAGDILGNVNRWLGQIGQPAITQEKLPDMVQHLPSELGDVAVVDLRGLPEQADPKKDGRIIAAIGTGDGATSFYKMRGNAEMVGAEKENFLRWITAMRASH
jgi:hypothetical protein